MVPVTIQGVAYTCMMYTNDLQVPVGNAGLMVVPFPNPTRATRFALVDATTTSDFRTQAEKALVDSGSLGFGMDGLTNQRAATYAAVHDVGNYRCSVVPDLASLQHSIDWAKFQFPDDLEARLAVLNDPSVVPPGCGFVVAQAIKSVSKDGFGVLFPGHHSLFPTCHEGNSALHDYDAVCYGFNMVLPKGRLVQDPTVLRRLQGAFAPKAVWCHDGSPVEDLAAQPFHLAAVMALKGVMVNANVKGLCTTVPAGDAMHAPVALMAPAAVAKAVRVLPPAPKMPTSFLDGLWN